MHAFEIRISRSFHAASLVWKAPHPSTYDALKRARELGARGDVVEVWRDHECVHRETVD